MKISVIIPAYNVEKYILKALNSVVNQTYHDIELIVVNDGSTDKTLNIVENFWKRVKPEGKIISIPNGGLANARNIGIKNAKGDYICNLDADDFLDINIFSKIFLKYNFDFDICYYGFRDVNENEEVLNTYEKKFIYTSAQKIDGISAAILKLKRKIWICSGSAIYNKKLIEKNALYNISGINQGEDLYFITGALIYSNDVYCIDSIGVNIRIRQNSMMRDKYNESFSQTIIACENLLKKAKKFPNDSKEKEKLISFIENEYINQNCYVAKKIISSYSIKNLFLIKNTILLKTPFIQLSIKDTNNSQSLKKRWEQKIYIKHLLVYIFIVKVVYRLKYMGDRLKINDKLF